MTDDPIDDEVIAVTPGRHTAPVFLSHSDVQFYVRVRNTGAWFKLDASREWSWMDKEKPPA